VPPPRTGAEGPDGVSGAVEPQGREYGLYRLLGVQHSLLLYLVIAGAYLTTSLYRTTVAAERDVGAATSLRSYSPRGGPLDALWAPPPRLRSVAPGQGTRPGDRAPARGVDVKPPLRRTSGDPGRGPKPPENPEIGVFGQKPLF